MPLTECLVCALKFVVHFVNNRESFKHYGQQINIIIAMLSRESILQQWKISERMSELEFPGRRTKTQRMVLLSGW